MTIRQTVTRECVYSFNAESLKKVIDEDGCLVQFDVPIARSGAFQYRAFEFGLTKNDGVDPNKMMNVYRDDASFSLDILSKNLDIPFTNDHPDGPVNVDNAKFIRVGSVNGLYFQDGILYAKQVKVYDQKTIDDIEKGGKKEVSIGFEAYYDFTPVTINNTLYDGTEEVVRINHLSLVSAGKAGPEFKMHQKENNDMATSDQIEIELEGVKAKVSPQEAFAITNSKTEKRFSDVENKLEQILSSVNALAKSVANADEDEKKDAENEEQEEAGVDVSNSDEDEKKDAENEDCDKDSENEDEDTKEDVANEDEEKKDDSENSIEDNAGSMKNDALSGQVAALYGNSDNQNSYKGLGVVCNAERTLSKDHIKQASFSEIAAAVRAKYCA